MTIPNSPLPEPIVKFIRLSLPLGEASISYQIARRNEISWILFFLLYCIGHCIGALILLIPWRVSCASAPFCSLF